MASPLDAEVTPAVHEHNDLLSKLRAAKPYTQCCENITFFMVTVLTIADLVTDVWLIVHFGQQKHVIFLAIGIMSVLVCHIGTATMYALQMKSEENHSFFRLYGCLVLNFPCHLGIIAHRLNYNCRNCEACFDPSEASINIYGSPKANTKWKFAKIKLAQSMLQCTPQLTLNLLHMHVYSDNVSLLQSISATLSFLSLVLGVTAHEKARREQIRGCTVTFVTFSCIFTYETLLLGSRVMAITSFVFMYGAWAAAVLAPHFALVLILFFYLYRTMWPIPYYKIILHSVYGIVAYFPIHGEYRPDGEIIMCYSMYILENIMMACLPFGISPTMDVPARLQPGSKQYLAMCLLIVCASAMGTLFLVLYNCFLDSPYSSIPSQQRTGCLARVCNCLSRPRAERSAHQQPPSSLNLGVSLYIDENDGEMSSGPSRLRKQKVSIDSTYLATQTGSGPPRYRTLPSEGNMTPPGLADSPTAPVVLCELDHPGSITLKSPSGIVGISGTLVITPEMEAANRPSVLEGDDDDSETEIVHDSDQIPLQP